MHTKLWVTVRAAIDAARRYGRPVWVYQFGREFGYRFGPLSGKETVATELVAVFEPDGKLRAINVMG